MLWQHKHCQKYNIGQANTVLHYPVHHAANGGIMSSIGSHPRPVLVLWGAEDVDNPLRRLPLYTKTFSQATTHVLEKSASLFLLEKPDETFAYVRDFLGIHDLKWLHPNASPSRRRRSLASTISLSTYSPSKGRRSLATSISSNHPNTGAHEQQFQTLKDGAEDSFPTSSSFTAI
jgi:hypothetical protein